MATIQEKVLSFVRKHDSEPTNIVAEAIPAQNITPVLAEEFSNQILNSLSPQDLQKAYKILFKYIPSQIRDQFQRWSLDSYYPLQLSDKFKMKVKNAMLDLMRKSDFVFIGEDHAANDESLFTSLMGDFYKSGVRYLALEINVSEQGAMDHFISTADASRFTDHSDHMNKIPVQRLIQAAVKNGIKIVCVDQNTNERTNKENREQYISEQLNQLGVKIKGKKEKILVWMGANHATKDTKPFPTVHSLISSLGYETSGVKLESQSGIDYEHQHSSSYRQYDVDTTLVAFTTYFSRSSPAFSFAYPTIKMGSLKFPFLRQVGTQKNYHYEKRIIPYKNGFDYVVFLSKTDNGDGGSSKF